MGKKMMLLAMAAISMAAVALPAMAIAEDAPVHLLPKPEKQSQITGGFAALSWSNTTTVGCEKTEGSATWENGTTGTINLTFGNKCPTGLSCGGNIGPVEAKGLPFHLVTLPGGKPGVLITPLASGVFAVIHCFFLNFPIEGNGLIGTIVAPECGKESSTATIRFIAEAHGVQADRTVQGTEAEYHLTTSGEGFALAFEATITFEGKKRIECT